jgi:hypothetical protein
LILELVWLGSVTVCETPKPTYDIRVPVVNLVQQLSRFLLNGRVLGPLELSQRILNISKPYFLGLR